MFTSWLSAVNVTMKPFCDYNTTLQLPSTKHSIVIWKRYASRAGGHKVLIRGLPYKRKLSENVKVKDFAGIAFISLVSTRIVVEPILSH